MAGFERVLIICPPHLTGKWEAGGGADGAPGKGRRRHLHHRPGEAQALHRHRPPLRRDEQGTRQTLLPLEARRHLPVGDLQGQTGQGRRDGGALPGPLLSRLHGAGGGQGRRAPDRHRPEPPQARLPRLRRSPLAGRQVRPQALPIGRLHQAQDEWVSSTSASSTSATSSRGEAPPRESLPAS